MNDRTRTVLVICSCVMSVVATGYAVACHSMVKSCDAAWQKDISAAIEKAKADQQVRNDAFVDFAKSISDRYMQVSGKVAVLEAKNIVRGE